MRAAKITFCDESNNLKKDAMKVYVFQKISRKLNIISHQLSKKFRKRSSFDTYLQIEKPNITILESKKLHNVTHKIDAKYFTYDIFYASKSFGQQGYIRD